MRYKKLGQEAEKFLAFPVLAALARRPMSLRELSHAMLVSRDTVTLRLRELAKMGYIIKREDRRWEMKVALSVAPAPTAEAVLYNGSHEATAAPGGMESWRHYKAPEDIPDPAKVSAKLGEQLKIPYEHEGLGYLSAGKLDKCHSCLKLTPYRYGITSLCPICSRGWSKTLKV